MLMPAEQKIEEKETRNIVRIKRKKMIVEKTKRIRVMTKIKKERKR